MLQRKVFTSSKPFNKNSLVLQLTPKRNATVLQHPKILQNAKPFREIPSPPKQWITGHAPLFVKNMKMQHKFHNEMRKTYGNIVRFSVLGRNIVALYGPEEGSTMYGNEGRYPFHPGFENFAFFRKSREDLYPSPGVFGTQGEEWHKNRSAVQQDMMRAKSAMYYIPAVEQISNELLELVDKAVDENSTLDVYPLLRLWSFESIASIFLAKRFYCFNSDNLLRNQDGQLMLEADEAMNESNMNLLFMPKIWQFFSNFIPAYKIFASANETLHKIGKKNVDAALHKLNLDDVLEQSILAKFARKNGKDSPLINTMVQDALIAGIDTTGSTSSFALYHLAANKDKQELVYKEICEVIGNRNESVTESKLNKMKYLKAFLHESQRMLPVVIGTGRIPYNDYVISGYRIPKGTFVLYYSQVASMCSDNFKNPEVFLPERWLRSCPDAKSAHPFSSLPFGHGPRSCIGKRFALVEIYCLIIKVLQKYRIEYHGEPVDTCTSFINTPDREVIIKFINRK